MKFQTGPARNPNKHRKSVKQVKEWQAAVMTGLMLIRDDDLHRMFSNLSEALTTKIREAQLDIVRYERFERPDMAEQIQERLDRYQRWQTISVAFARYLGTFGDEEGFKCHVLRFVQDFPLDELCDAAMRREEPPIR